VKRLALLTVLVASVSLMAAAPASAYGPAAPGKATLEIDCGSAGTLLLSLATLDHANNAVGQIIDEQGLGIPTAVTFTATDETTNTVLFSNTTPVGNGNAHPNQTTTACSFVPFAPITAAEFFGAEPLPDGVAPTDTITGLITVEVILKLS
jgi:hypothetical protein